MLDERAVELETLAAIYSANLIMCSDYAGCIDTPVALRRPLCILAEGNEHEVSYLPAVRISFGLPSDYPDKVAPTAKVTAFWLSDEVSRRLEAEAASLWEEYGRTPVIYAYLSQIEEAAEDAFGINCLEVEANILHQVLEYDRDAKRHAFEQGTYECGVCLDPKKGSSCHKMETCKHVFCINCLQTYYNNAILTGNISDVKCPDFACGDKPTQRAALITPRELLRIPIERPAVQRYVKLKRKKKLESDKTTIWCPRRWCQGAAKGNNYPRADIPLDDMGIVFEYDVTPNQDEPHKIANGEEDKAEESDPLSQDTALLASRLQICEDCSYAFCRLCSQTWHGDFFDCRASSDRPPPPKTLTEIEEEASLDFIRQNTSKCPKCDTPVQKSEACNHMTCTQCRSHFCYLCSAYLNPLRPYAHFNKPGSFCHQRLWEGQFGEGVNR